MNDPRVLLVHVTPFNRLMWDSGDVPTRVIEHGIQLMHPAEWTGELEVGIVVVDHLTGRGRRLGHDVFEAARRQVPLVLVGSGAEEAGGRGEIRPPDLAPFMARYRFLFNPIRWSGLELAVCEAMTVGLPIVGLATTEMSSTIENGVSGWVDTDVDRLVLHMRALLADRDLARRLSVGARSAAQRRFGIERFVRDWSEALADVTAARRASATAAGL